MTANDRHEAAKGMLKQTAEETLPRAPMKVNGKMKRLGDEKLNKLSKRQMKLSKQTRRCRGRINKIKRQKLKEKRRETLRETRERAQELNEAKTMELAEEMESNKGNRRALEVARIMSKSQDVGFSLYDAEHGKLHETAKTMKEITRLYSSFFAREGVTKTQQWRGEPKQLTEETTGEEATMAAKRLRSHRALGPDNVAGELIKRGGEETHEELATTYNATFKRRPLTVNERALPGSPPRMKGMSRLLSYATWI